MPNSCQVGVSRWAQPSHFALSGLPYIGTTRTQRANHSYILTNDITLVRPLAAHLASAPAIPVTALILCPFHPSAAQPATLQPLSRLASSDPFAAVDSLAAVARWLSVRTRSWERRRRVAHAKRQQTSTHTITQLHHSSHCPLHAPHIECCCIVGLLRDHLSSRVIVSSAILAGESSSSSLCGTRSQPVSLPSLSYSRERIDRFAAKVWSSAALLRVSCPHRCDGSLPSFHRACHSCPPSLNR